MQSGDLKVKTVVDNKAMKVRRRYADAESEEPDVLLLSVTVENPW